MRDPQIVYNYLLAGKSIVTLTDLNSNRYCTYKINKMDYKVWAVMLYVGADEFKYIGVIRDGMFNHTYKSRVNEESFSFGLFDSLVIGLKNNWEVPANIEVEHSGFCGRCGKRLTTPESLLTGLGPVCAGK